MSCKTMNIDLANVPPVPIQIGVAGENAFRTITFDASTWGADFPDATYTVVYKRSDGYIYPVLVNAAADAIVWSPTDTDTAVSGNGQIEVRLLDGETIGKTIVMQTFVAPSLSGDESEPSTPAPDWVNDVAADADRAEAAVSHYPKIVNGVWFVWDATQSEFVSTGINAQGEDGVSPTVTVTEIEGGHRVTITDTDGAHTFDVMDGQGGSGGSETVVVTINGTTDPMTASMTAAEIKAAVDDGKRVVLQTDGAEIPYQAYFGSLAVFSTVAEIDSNEPICLTITIAGNGRVLPSATSLARMSDIPSLSAYRTASAQDTIDAAQDAAIAAKYTKPSGGIPASDLDQAVQTSLSKADTALQSAPVTSVNNKTGAVVLSASDVGALPSSTSVPTKVSDLTNDSNFQTAAQVQSAIAAAAELPSVTASDNGKFLRVVNGAWAAQAVPIHEPRVAMTASDTTPTLNPNTLYVFPEMASLAITLATPTDASVVNEYHFIFTSGATATTLSIPATVNQPDGFTVDANMVYEVSILENNMTAMSWEVSA